MLEALFFVQPHFVQPLSNFLFFLISPFLGESTSPDFRFSALIVPLSNLWGEFRGPKLSRQKRCPYIAVIRSVGCVYLDPLFISGQNPRHKKTASLEREAAMVAGSPLFFSAQK